MAVCPHVMPGTDMLGKEVVKLYTISVTAGDPRWEGLDARLLGIKSCSLDIWASSGKHRISRLADGKGCWPVKLSLVHGVMV